MRTIEDSTHSGAAVSGVEATILGCRGANLEASVDGTTVAANVARLVRLLDGCIPSSFVSPTFVGKWPGGVATGPYEVEDDAQSGIDATQRSLRSITFQTCGNGVPEPGEECDDGNFEYCDACTPECTLPEFCQDGAPCTNDQCDSATGACNFPPFPGCCSVAADCQPWDACTSGVCDSATNTCDNFRIAGCIFADGFESGDTRRWFD